MNYIFSLAELLPRSELVIMGRVKGLHPGSSKDIVQCPVDGCIKVKVRRDNWIKHMKNQVIVGNDNKPVSQGSLQFKTASKEKQNHTLLLISGSFSLDNLPDPIIVEEHVMEKENNLDISSMFKKIQPPAAAASPETVTRLRKETGRCC